MAEYKQKRIIDIGERPRYVILNGRGIIIDKNPNKERLSQALLWDLKYNETGTCSVCEDEKKITEKSILCHGNAYQEKDKDRKKTGRWICKNHWGKDYQKYDPYSQNNAKKSVRDRRTDNQDPNSTNAKGDKFQKLMNISKNLVDLNQENDNYLSPIDSIDPRTGLLYQAKGKWYDPINRYWSSNWERDHNKKFYKLIYYCTSEDGKIIERIYEFPKEEVKKRTRITIMKNPMNSRGTCPIIPWYEKYRVTDEEELKKANEIWQDKIKNNQNPNDQNQKE